MSPLRRLWHSSMFWRCMAGYNVGCVAWDAYNAATDSPLWLWFMLGVFNVGAVPVSLWNARHLGQVPA